ncbi:hypothetical protein BWQ96_05657 [Gracilariopsis chorda]|uniref:Glycosyltransferase family 92 protein n=1 Tax=Gracilariopsis chorda TaxID=448386 RepID=A0A2V3ITZ1_9FLOR|nr:hypothetical protein BWQ96_05657 [Gracilariopsis chorda]|eukprot:PXF44580.1 hypothetical protein BWQ96_05657 [Gracilariopsis chorda]
MPEFLVRNYAAGVDHFYIYGDDDDDFEEINRLRQIFSFLGDIVTYIPHGRAAPTDREDPQRYVQMRMYRHCLQKYGRRSKWMTFIDTDEFFETYALSQIESNSTNRNRRAFLHDILTSYDYLPVLCVRWKSALTNGRILPPRSGEFLHDMFPRACKILIGNNGKLSAKKTILQTKYVDLERSPRYDEGLHKGFVFQGPGSNGNISCKAHLGKNLEPPIHIVHYWSRDLSSFLRKIRRGRPRKTVPSRTLYDLFEREQMCEADGVTSSADIRNGHITGLLRNFPLSYYPQLRLASAEMALGSSSLQQVRNVSLCENHVRYLVARISEGKDFLNSKYCEERPSEACKLFLSSPFMKWPFPWAEYLMSCDEISDEERFFA